MKNVFHLLPALLLIFSCNGDEANKEPATNSKQSIPQERTNPNPTPVATYSENITTETGRLNHWKFAVDLYETHKTFVYRIQVQYAELTITDSLQLPDLGIAPKPVLKKGNAEYSCIVGFIDNNEVYRDYKLVSVTDGNLRIHTLKYYSVQRTAAAQ